ncbi:MAG TPA: AAA family ATPase [Bacteroidales bacterium]|nr:AAA family ATPase [Bacteroidales bacterium]
MIKKHLEKLFEDNLEYEATPGQQMLIAMLSDFILKTDERSAFLIKGYAGTGKTTVIATLVKVLAQLKINAVLMAPTGRAAKVLSQYSATEASTIHKAIYRQMSSKDAMSKFVLGKNFTPNTIFIVDEASMISDQSGENAFFGSGNLLQDMISYVFSARNCKLILSGDTAQLPPVGMSLSNAMSALNLSGYNMKVDVCELTEVVGQTLNSGILSNATSIRNVISEHKLEFPKIKVGRKIKDITCIKGGEVMETLQEHYSRYGLEQSMIICRSNRIANRYNEMIRNRILAREEEVSAGDYLMVVKNNYHWFKSEGIDFIANGDIVKVKRVKKFEEMYGHRFATLDLILPDYKDVEFTAKVNLGTLRLETASFDGEENLKLYHAIAEDYISEKTKAKIAAKVREDPYYNALQIKYAYAVTCHKAQGGQWPVVFIDQSFFNDDMLNIDYLRWLYTAFTRATEHLVLVNFNEKFFPKTNSKNR